MMYDLGSRIKEMRKSRMMTQKDLALKINKSKAAISSYETNAQIPPLEVLVSIACVFRTSLDILVGLDTQNYYSTEGMSEEQKTIIDLLMTEFASPSSNDGTLSANQIDLIRRLIQLFSKSTTNKHSSMT